MRINTNKIKNFLLELGTGKRKYTSLLVVLLVIAGVFLGPSAEAAYYINEVVYSVLGWITSLFLWVVGRLIVVVIDVLISVSKYNGFVNAAPVREGWLILVGICNMFFILLLLIMAFGTVLGIDKYSFRSLFKKVILAAILINFSKLICSVIIDLAQVIMLTFVAGFKDIGAGNFTQLLGIDKLLEIRPGSSTSDTYVYSVVGSYILAMIYALVILLVLIVITATLVIRIVWLWILVLLSPLTFFASAVPGNTGLGKLTGSWWSSFTNQVVVGPVLAFFLWLSLSTLGSFTSDENKEFLDKIGAEQPADEASAGSQISVGGTQVGTPEHLFRFAISLGLLIGGLNAAKKMGGGAGTAAAWGSNKIKSGSNWMKRKAKRSVDWAGKKAKQGAKAVGTAAVTTGAGLARVVDYKVTGGQVGRAAAAIKTNVFTTEGYKKLAETVSRGVGIEANRAINQARLNATVSGKYVDAKGITYKYDAGSNRYVDENNPSNIAKVNGVELKPMSKGELTTYHAWNESKRVKEKNAKRPASPSEARIRDFAAKSKNLSQGELLNAAGKESIPERKMAYMLAAADKGSIGPEHLGLVKEAERLFAGETNLGKEFNEKRMKSSAHQIFDLDNESESKIFQGKAKKGEFNLKGLDINENSDIAQVTKAIEALKKALDPQEFGRQMREAIKEASPAKKEAIFKGSLEIANNELNKNIKDNFDKIKKRDPNKSDAQAASEAYTKAASNSNYLDLMKNVVAAGKGDINQALKIKINDSQPEVIKKALTQQTGQAANTEFTDDVMMRNFFKHSSAINLAELDASKMADDDFDNVVGGISGEVVKALEKSGKNNDLTENLLAAMARVNHADLGKVASIVDSGTKVNLQASTENAAVVKVMRTEGVDATDYGLINKVREEVTQSGPLKTGKGGKLDKAEHARIASIIRRNMGQTGPQVKTESTQPGAGFADQSGIKGVKTPPRV